MKNMKSHPKKSAIYEIYFCLFFFIAQTYLMLFSPIIGDDIFNSLLTGYYIILEKNIFEIIYIYIRDWLVINGRIHFTIPPLTVIFFEFFNTVILIKIAHYVLILSSVFSFLYFIYLSSKKNIYFTVLVFVLLPILFQYRDWHDPFLMFPTHYNILVLLFFTSISFFLKNFDQQKKAYYYFSIFLYILTCGTFEPAIFLSILYVYYDYKKNKKIKTSKIFIKISISFFLLIIYFRFINSFIFGPVESILFSKGGGYDGSEISFDLIKSSITIILQLIGSFPLTFLIKNQSINFSYLDVIIFILFGIFIYFFLKKNSKILFSKINFEQYFALNIVLFISLMPIGLSGKYIVDLPNKGFGYAHLPVYLQYFGTILIFLYLIFKILNFKNKYRIHFIAILLTLMGFLNFSSNKNVIYETLSPQKIIRDNAAKSFQKGLLDNIKNYSNIVFWESNYQLWKRPEFISTYSKKKLFTQYAYDTSFFDLFVDNKKKNLIINDKGLYRLSDLSIKKFGDKFKFQKSYNQYLNLKSELSINKITKDKIFQNSDKVYIFINLPNFKDNRAIVAKIDSFDVDKFNKVKNIFTNEIYFISKNEKKFNINLGTTINLNYFIENYDPQNSYNHFKKDNIIKFINNMQKNEMILSKKIPNTKATNENFYSGKFKCSKNEIIVSKFPRKIFGLINQNYNKINVKIFNNSNSLWDINNFNKKNPITIRSYLLNSKTQDTIAGINLSHKKIKIESGHYEDLVINFNDIVKIRSFLINKKSYDKIIFSLVEEGKQWFPNEEFESCKLNIIH